METDTELSPVEIAEAQEATRSEQRAQRLAVLKEKMQAIAHEMLIADAERGGDGIAFYQVRHAAETRGWLHDEEFKDRTLSFGAHIRRAAGGFAAGFVETKHRNGKGRIVRRFKLAQPAAEQTDVEPR